MYIYIIGHYNPSVWLRPSFSHHLQFKPTPSVKFFEKLVRVILFIFRAFATNLLRRSRRRNIFHIFILYPNEVTRPNKSNKSTHNLLDYGVCTIFDNCTRKFLQNINNFIFYLTKIFSTKIILLFHTLIYFS